MSLLCPLCIALYYIRLITAYDRCSHLLKSVSVWSSRSANDVATSFLPRRMLFHLFRAAIWRTQLSNSSVCRIVVFDMYAKMQIESVGLDVNRPNANHYLVTFWSETICFSKGWYKTIANRRISITDKRFPFLTAFRIRQWCHYSAGDVVYITSLGISKPKAATPHNVVGRIGASCDMPHISSFRKWPPSRHSEDPAKHPLDVRLYRPTFANNLCSPGTI